jgi:hypothetical protein
MPQQLVEEFCDRSRPTRRFLGILAELIRLSDSPLGANAENPGRVSLTC